MSVVFMNRKRLKHDKKYVSSLPSPNWLIVNLFFLFFLDFPNELLNYVRIGAFSGLEYRVVVIFTELFPSCFYVSA